MDFLIVCNLLVCMVKNKSWQSDLILAVIIRKYQKQDEISSEFTRSKPLLIAIFSTKKAPKWPLFIHKSTRIIFLSQFIKIQYKNVCSADNWLVPKILLPKDNDHEKILPSGHINKKKDRN